MRNYFKVFPIIFMLLSLGLQAQVGHVMQGVGAVNFSMGGASTAQPIDITGALQWNPATISDFNKTIIELNAGLFSASPELYSSVMMDDGSGGFIPLSGSTEGAKASYLIPSLGVVFGKEDSKFTWGIQAFGVSGFGVDYPEETNNPMSAGFDPTTANAILFPQSMQGFGAMFTEYSLLQVGVSVAYKLTNELSVGVTPMFNYSSLEIKPNPTADPSPTLGYSNSDKASSTGFGFQAGLYYKMNNGLKFGAAYKSRQSIKDYEFEGTYLDNSTAPVSKFKMDFPSIISAGVGYSNDAFDLAFDYRYINYSNTEGFEQSGWKIGSSGNPTGAVNGFGWESISVFSLGIQYKGINKLPVRLGYTHNSNPITEDAVFFSSSAPAIIENAIQAGLSFIASDKLTFNGGVHFGLKSEVSGQMMNPMLITADDPLGKIPQSEVKSTMNTSMYLVGITYSF